MTLLFVKKYTQFGMLSKSQIRFQSYFLLIQTFRETMHTYITKVFQRTLLPASYTKRTIITDLWSSPKTTINLQALVTAPLFAIRINNRVHGTDAHRSLIVCTACPGVFSTASVSAIQRKGISKLGFQP